ncbi:anthrone oxygenase family protein [Streptomyces sp. RFCAC02]|uniref:anthrone oxygenase family protein n=1 Tax=Streptomyces sp. RFCAC02 TaxID=2499143 RepID=UPI001021EF40|nr:anthrone oxygenase family protein [Streptomyces sp. RFCAC02]
MAILLLICAILTLVTAGLMAGTFFGFSVSVIPGLDAIAPEEAVRAMQSMNEKILNPLFLGAFVGVPVAAAGAGVLLLRAGHRAAAIAFLAAAAVYFFGALMPTGAINVPMNDVLAAATPSADAWADFSARWARWNAVRTAASVVTVVLAGWGMHLWRTAR